MTRTHVILVAVLVPLLALGATLAFVSATGQRPPSVAEPARTDLVSGAPLDEQPPIDRWERLGEISGGVQALTFHVENDDIEALAPLLVYHPLPCVEQPPVGSTIVLTSPICPEGVPVGEGIGRFVVQGCGVTLVTDTAAYLATLLPEIGSVYAVAATDDLPLPPGWVRGEYVVVFEPARGRGPSSAAAFYLDSRGLVDRIQVCATPQQLLREGLTGPRLEVLLPPPRF